MEKGESCFLDELKGIKNADYNSEIKPLNDKIDEYKKKKLDKFFDNAIVKIRENIKCKVANGDYDEKEKSVVQIKHCIKFPNASICYALDSEAKNIIEGIKALSIGAKNTNTLHAFLITKNYDSHSSYTHIDDDGDEYYWIREYPDGYITIAEKLISSKRLFSLFKAEKTFECSLSQPMCDKLTWLREVLKNDGIELVSGVFEYDDIDDILEFKDFDKKITYVKKCGKDLQSLFEDKHIKNVYVNCKVEF